MSIMRKHHKSEHDRTPLPGYGEHTTSDEPPPGSAAQSPDPQQLKALADFITGLFERISGPRRRPEVVEELGFADVVAYFTEKHPGDPRIAAGALLCRPHPRGTLAFLVFLDDNDRPCKDPAGTPYGRRMVATSFDEELTRRLHGDSLLIFR